MKSRRLFSFALICVLLVSIIFGGADVSAKSKVALKVTYKGKTVTLIKDNDEIIKNPVTYKKVSIKNVQKAWGKGSSKTTKLSGTTTTWKTYTWKTKKTKISIADNHYPGKVGAIDISIKDKNGSIAGVKVGMTKAQALKKLKKAYGLKHIQVQGDFIRIDNLGMNSFTVKSGKIVSMGYYGS